MGHAQPYFTWQGKDSTPPTNAEMVASSIALAEAAARAQQEAQAAYDRSAPGSLDCARASSALSQAVSDQHHWRDYAQYYRDQLALELGAVRARDVARAAAESRRQAELELVKLPPRMETGDYALSADDWENERESAYAELGGAVAGAQR